MQLVYPTEQGEIELLAFIEEEIGEKFNPASCTPVGVVSSAGQLVAAWVWHNWSREAGTIEFSGAAISPRWMTREILHALFAYAFGAARCQMVVTRNSAKNTRLHRQLKRFGFDRIDLPRLFGRYEDGVIWTLTDDQWRASEFYIEGVPDG